MCNLNFTFKGINVKKKNFASQTRGNITLQLSLFLFSTLSLVH